MAGRPALGPGDTGTLNITDNTLVGLVPLSSTVGWIVAVVVIALRRDGVFRYAAQYGRAGRGQDRADHRADRARGRRDHRGDRDPELQSWLPLAIIVLIAFVAGGTWPRAPLSVSTSPGGSRAARRAGIR